MSELRDNRRAEQIQRERSQRDAALGRRTQSAQDGTLGPVIARWINTSVGPIAERLRLASKAYIGKEFSEFASLLDSPVFGLCEAVGNDNGGNSLWPILQWCLKGKSPGRAGDIEGRTTYADDMVLACLGTVISMIATSSLHDHRTRDDHKRVSLAAALGNAGDACRETGVGQFITQVQGAEAMLRMRRPDRSSWAQSDAMQGVAHMMQGQVRTQLEAEARGELNLERVGTRAVLKVMTQLKERRVSLRPPEVGDWQFLESVLKAPKREADPNKAAWVNFALIILCCAQAEHGWFDLMMERKAKQAKGRHYKARYLVFADEPFRHLRKDLDKWLHLGFVMEPMIVKPEMGDYLTVKHRPIAGRPGPMGNRTEAVDGDGKPCSAFQVACDVMADTPWQVARETLEALKEGGELYELAKKTSVSGDDALARRIIGEYSRVAGHGEIFLPIYMDFRGRVYPKTTWVTYQGTDMQKGLLRFPHRDENLSHPAVETIDRHLKNLRKDDSYVQEFTAAKLYESGQWNSIPCQIDGTCNGLQHLSALFRDETAAPWVNLDPCTFEDHKADIYGRVAEGVLDDMSGSRSMGFGGPALYSSRPAFQQWMKRVTFQTKINRGLLKKPVMVLPYGGTMNAIEDAITLGILSQNPSKAIWTNPEDPDVVAGGYGAFEGRELKDHPLFRSDMKKLSSLVYANIKKVIPRAMDAMDAFRDIAGKVGERTLEWSTGFGTDPLWVVHAYPKSARSGQSLRGLHFPNSVRGLQLKSGRDEVDPRAHRSGIVANFIHSQDAGHLARTMEYFKEAGGTSFGAIHDCYLARPSEMGILNRETRVAFFGQYRYDPLSYPTRLRDLVSGKVESYDSWYLMAKDLGVSFPDRGKWDPAGVLKSSWFFS